MGLAGAFRYLRGASLDPLFEGVAVEMVEESVFFCVLPVLAQRLF